MTGPLEEQDDASTLLTAEEKDGLIPSYITLRGELNEAEQANILEAEGWSKNIGIEHYRIPQELRLLLDDCQYWIEHSTYDPDEIAARFHHRLVWIHLYPNGNGRHARLAADLLLVSLGKARFSWGSASLTDPAQTQKRYVAALQQADNHNIDPLLEFVRS